MKFDVNLPAADLNAVPAIARAAEEYGFDGIWTSETAHNPFLPLTHAAAATTRTEIGTAVAIAFPRSPMMTAQVSWDLAAQSSGRFILGLGTQVKPHIEKRFSAVWGAPVPRLREYIEALRAIWHSFQTGASLRYSGEHYRFSLLTPFFTPPPIAAPDIPVYIAGVNEGLCQLAGEVCQGFHVHPFHTPHYLRELVLPSIAAGAAKAGRTRADCTLASAVFVISGTSREAVAAQTEAVRAQIAFYASTPSYRVVMDMHGWGDLHERLNSLSRLGRWGEMGALISDEMLAHFVVTAPPDSLAQAVQERYRGLLDRVGYYLPFTPDDAEQRALWQNAATVFAH